MTTQDTQSLGHQAASRGEVASPAPRSKPRASERRELPVRPLTDAQIERGWRDTFSTNNPFCPCDLKTFTKAARWTEANVKRDSVNAELLAALRDVIGWVPVGPGCWHTDAPVKAIERARTAINRAQEQS